MWVYKDLLYTKMSVSSILREKEKERERKREGGREINLKQRNEEKSYLKELNVSIFFNGAKPRPREGCCWSGSVSW